MNNFLSPPAQAHIRAIEQVLRSIETALPIPGSHRRDLPVAVRDLSSLLTDERNQGLSQSYWATRRLASAYYYYFLPWNLFRLAWVLPSLPFNLQANDRVLDLGCGPLTLPLALWCAKPELRSLPLSFSCVDMAAQPMTAGREVFRALEEATGSPLPWTFELVRSQLETAPSRFAPGFGLIMGGNALNELASAHGSTQAERVCTLTANCAKRLRPGGSLFFAEPGTRLGGKLIALTRENLLRAGLAVQSPCPHSGPCPMLSHRTPHGGLFSGWCHFNCPAKGAPKQLEALTKQAKFTRHSLAVAALFAQNSPKQPEEKVADHESCLRSSSGQTGPQDTAMLFDDGDAGGFMDALAELEALYNETMDEETAPQKAMAKRATERNLARPGQQYPAPPDPPIAARIISGPISLPGSPLQARYACSGAGLLLVRHVPTLPHGAGIMVSWQKIDRDGKTGALLVDMVGRSPDATVRPGTATRPGTTAKPEKASDPRKPRTARTGGKPKEKSRPEKKDTAQTEKRKSRPPIASRARRPKESGRSSS